MGATKATKPAADSANGLREYDLLGRRITSIATPKSKILKAIRATQTGEDTYWGVSAHGMIPMFRLCRQLVEAAHDPARALHVCGDVLALIVRRMEEGDRLRKGDNG
jgi:hypothetical protein